MIIILSRQASQHCFAPKNVGRDESRPTKPRYASGAIVCWLLSFCPDLPSLGLVWFIAQRDYEPAIAIVTSLSAFIAAWFGDKKLKRQANQNQTVSKSGIGIQAGGDVSMGSIRTSRKTPDAE